MNLAVRTTCPYCGVGCGVRATPSGAGAAVAGDPEHPSNRGRLCSKGAALDETLGSGGRLLHPMVHGKRASWDEALDVVAQRFGAIVERDGPEATALYVSGQLLTEDYYVANKFMKGYIGSANIDTNSRLCMASAVAGHKRAFGADLVPVCYEDLELADLVVLVGSNTAWCHPILYQRIVAAKRARPQMKLVVIDPRRTATCEDAELHLPVKPGSDTWLFNGLLVFLHEHGLSKPEFVAAHTRGAEEAIAAALATTGSLAHVARACGVGEERLREFYALFARTEKTVTMFSQGVNQSSSGVDKVNSIINCHLLTGRIGRPGMGPFSVTGQPNAMGGREVGGLSNQLAAHLELGEPAHRVLVQEFWGSPRIAQRPGLKAVELFDAIHAGRVKAVWIAATNPVVSLPDANRVREALARCELVVVSDVTANTDTAALAHVLLPAAAWGEKDGTVTNSERRISRQRAFLPPAGEAKPDWWIVSEVARRMGYAGGFGYRTPHEIFVEHARLSVHRQAEAPRVFNLGGLAQLEAAAYDTLEPVQWPVAEGGEGTARLFGDGRFARADGRARFVPLVPRAPRHAPDDEYPLVLNTGRIRDQWHTMTRTGLSPKLAAHVAEPFLEIHPHDAMLWGVQDRRLARVESRWGSCVLRVKTGADVARRQVFVPIHWNGQTASDARVGALVNPVVDPISGEPEFKHTPVRVAPFEVDWHGFVLSRRPLARAALDATAWWVLIQGAQFLRYELAGRSRLPDWSGWAQTLLGAGEAGDWIEASDVAEGQYRGAGIADDRIEACVFVSARADDLPARAWLTGLFAQERLAEADRVGLLVGAPLDPKADTGPNVCSCFGVGRNTILRAIRDGANTADRLGARLKCGTNCGSCIPELKGLIAASAAQASAA